MKLDWLWLVFPVVVIIVGCPKEEIVSVFGRTKTTGDTCFVADSCYPDIEPPRPPEDEL